MLESKNDINSLKNKGLDLTFLIVKTWYLRFKLCKVALIGALIGLVVALSVPQQYSVLVKLSPEMSNTKSGGSLASLASSFLGGGFTQNGTDALNALLAPEIVSSTPFLLELLDSQIGNYGEKESMTFYEYLESESKPWWTIILNAPFKFISIIKSNFISRTDNIEICTDRRNIILLKGKEISKINQLRSNILAMVDKKRGLITLKVKLQDPVVAAVISDSVVSKLQRYIIKYKLSKARTDCLYWQKLYNESKEKYYEAQKQYARYVDVNTNIVYQSTMVEKERLRNELSLAYQVYTQVSEQYQLSKAKLQEEKPAFTIVEPSVIPNYPSSTSKIRIVLTFVLLSLVIAMSWEFVLKGIVDRLKVVVPFKSI